MTGDVQVVSAKLDRAQVAAVDRLAARTGCCRQEIVRAALRAYLERPADSAPGAVADVSDVLGDLTQAAAHISLARNRLAGRAAPEEGRP